MVCGNMQYIQRDIGYLDRIITMGAPLSLLGNALYRKLLVLQEVCCQQWDMYLRKRHQTEERIVSIDQPHIRPIVRGKAGSPVEFGTKVMVGLVGECAFLMKAQWNNFSESKGLVEAVEEYRRLFGFYPAVIFPSRENKLWFGAHGIRLSGPRLGRKSMTEKESERKQIYQDGCDRVAIEGKFGVVKRRYGLDRILCHLLETSITSIAMGFFAANLERKLRLLFCA